VQGFHPWLGAQPPHPFVLSSVATAIAAVFRSENYAFEGNLGLPVSILKGKIEKLVKYEQRSALQAVAYGIDMSALSMGCLLPTQATGLHSGSQFALLYYRISRSVELNSGIKQWIEQR
jgi:hypothetical protein